MYTKSFPLAAAAKSSRSLIVTMLGLYGAGGLLLAGLLFFGPDVDLLAPLYDQLVSFFAIDAASRNMWVIACLLVAATDIPMMLLFLSKPRALHVSNDNKLVLENAFGLKTIEPRDIAALTVTSPGGSVDIVTFEMRDGVKLAVAKNSYDDLDGLIERLGQLNSALRVSH